MNVGRSQTTDGPRYGRVAILLHWAIAFLILFNLSVGFWMEDLVEPYRTLVVRLHQSSGMTVLLLTAMRVLWRLTHRPPPLDPHLSRPERILASSVHLVLYVAMVGLPLSGWALISANPPRFIPTSPPSVAAPGSLVPSPRKPFRIKLWGVVPLIPIKPIQDIALEPGGRARQHVLHEDLVQAHTVAGYTLLALLVLHVLGALKHEVLDGRPELFRMGIGRRPQQIDPDPESDATPTTLE